MEIGVRELRNRTSEVIGAVKAGERVVLTVHGEPVADIIPHVARSRWVDGPAVWRELESKQADAELTNELSEIAGATLDDE
jgi:prevent-host-death family protein